MSEPGRREMRVIASPGDMLAWVSALVLALSSFMG
jgi:hypothetical protein